MGCCPWCWRCSCPRDPTSPIFRGAGLGSCQEHTVINQQVWNGKPNSKGGRGKEFLYWFAESVPKELSFFLSFLNQEPCLWQFSSPGPELNISIFREKHRTKFSLPRWINGTSFDSQSPIFPLKSHPFSLLHRDSMLNFVYATYLLILIAFFFKKKKKQLFALGTSCNWNHIACAFLLAAFFHQCYALEMDPHCCIFIIVQYSAIQIC